MTPRKRGLAVGGAQTCHQLAGVATQQALDALGRDVELEHEWCERIDAGGQARDGHAPSAPEAHLPVEVERERDQLGNMRTEVGPQLQAEAAPRRVLRGHLRIVPAPDLRPDSVPIGQDLRQQG